jgi:predicted nicotinamide N-methyase
VLALIERARARGASVLGGDIGRKFLPRQRFRVVDSRDVPVVAQLEDSAVKRTKVWAPAW